MYFNMVNQYDTIKRLSKQEDFIVKEKERTEAYIHYIMSLSGGFMGAYALLNRCEIFGSAQTANMIHSILDLSSGSWTSLLLRLGSLLIFITAIIAATLIPRLISIDIRLICILAEIPVIAVLGFFPAHMDPLMALYPVFFIMAFQWCSFTGVKGYASSTIFSTNNLRQFISSLSNYFADRNKKHLEKAWVYGFTLFFYHIGVALCWYFTKLFGILSVWLCLLPLFLVLVLVGREHIFINLRSFLQNTSA